MSGDATTDRGLQVAGSEFRVSSFYLRVKFYFRVKALTEDKAPKPH